MIATWHDLPPGRQLRAAELRRTRWAARATPMSTTTAAADGFGDQSSAGTAQPGGESGGRADTRLAAVVADPGEVLAKASSIPGTKAAMSWGPLLVVSC